MKSRLLDVLVFIIALLLIVLLIDTVNDRVVKGHEVDYFQDVYADITNVRLDSVYARTRLIEEVDVRGNLQKWEVTLSDILVVMDSVTPDTCYMDWYSLVRSETNTFIESIALRRADGPFWINLDEAAVRLFLPIEYSYRRARANCPLAPDAKDVILP